MANVLSLIIKARDGASSILGRINDAVGGLGGAADKASSGLANATEKAGFLSGAIAGGIIQAQLLGAAFSQVQSAIGFVQGKLAEAASIQTENIQNIGTLASLTSISYEKAEEFVDQLNIKIAELGKSLPVASQDIKMVAGAIQDDLIEAFKTANGVDFKGLETALTTISSDFAVLGKSANVAAEDVQQGLGRFLGGGSQGEYEELNLFARNNALRNELNRQLKGRKNQDLAVKERVKILQDVGKKLNTEETKKRLAGSVEGLIANLTDSLFDPDTGIFGFTKDLDKSTKKKESVLTSYNAALEGLIGSNGIFTNLGTLLESAGVKLADPMAVLKSGIDKFTSAVATVNEALGAAREFYNMGSNLPQVIKSLISYFDLSPQRITTSFADFRTRLVANFDRFFINIRATLAKINFEAIGKYLGQSLSILISSITSIISRINWTAVGQSIGGIISSLWITIINFLANVDWNAVLSAVGKIFDGVVNFLAGYFRTLSTTLLPKMLAFVQNMELPNFDDLVRKGLAKLGNGIATVIASIDWNALIQIGLVTLDQVMRSNLPLIASSMIIVGTALMAGIAAITALLATVGIPAVLAVAAFSIGYWAGTVLYDWWTKDLWPSVTKWWNKTTTEVGAKWNSTWDTVGNFFNEIFDKITNWWNDLIAAGKLKISEVLKDPLSLFGNQDAVSTSTDMSATSVGSSFAGLVPSGIAGSLVAAAAVESKNMPAGAKLTVANDSEAIIPKDRVLALAGNNAPVSRNVSVNFAPIFNVQGVSDPQAIAQMALDELDGMLRNYVEGQLA